MDRDEVIHNLNNLLAVIVTYAEFALADLGDRPPAAEVQQIRQAAAEAVALLRAQAAEAPVPATTEIPPAAGRRVLVVDDDAGVREVVRLILGGQGYEVTLAAEADEALGLPVDQIDILLTDLTMDGMPGVELAQRFAERHGELRIVFMSGHSERPAGLPATARFIAKPFSRDALLRAVGAAGEGR